MEISEVLTVLSRANGVSGQEDGVAAVAKVFLEPLVDRTEITPLGNLIGYRASKQPDAKTVLLDAHLDQIGLVVTGQKNGRLTFTGGVGGVDDRMLPGLQVMMLTEPVRYGVISCGGPDAEEDKPIARTDLRIDCGISEVEAKEIPVGTRIAYATEPWPVGTHFFGTSLDNRSCYLSLLRAMELTKDEELPVHVAVLGSVQEEQGGLGALTGAYAVHPDVALVADVTFGDSPDSPKGFPLGSGAAIGYSPVLDRDYTLRLQRLAQQQNIPYVREVMSGSTGTNSMHTQIAGEGVPSVLLSLPLRYMHTPVEEIDLRDVEAVAQLIAAFLRSFGEEEQPC